MKKNFNISFALRTLAAVCMTVAAVSLSSCIGCSDFLEDEESDSTKLASLSELFEKAVCEDGNTKDGAFEYYGLDSYTDDETGETYPIAYFSYGGVVFEIIDTDLDGVFDVAVSDLNDDDDISDEEIIDITDQNIKVADLEDQETSEYCATGNDDDSECYTSDDDDDEGGVCAPDNGYTRTPTGTPARQQREEQAESDLPDYVNNANVKGLLKK